MKTLDVVISLGITATQAQALVNLREANLSMTSISLICGVSTAAVTGMVDRLVKKGLVQRVDSKFDRRIITVELTDKGREYADKIGGDA
jgi:DNA-binding MarR family transcriptional regulator